MENGHSGHSKNCLTVKAVPPPMPGMGSTFFFLTVSELISQETEEPIVMLLCEEKSLTAGVENIFGAEDQTPGSHGRQMLYP